MSVAQSASRSRDITYIGIDPGISGALAVMRPNDEIIFHDMPLVQLEKRRSVKMAVAGGATKTVSKTRIQNQYDAAQIRWLLAWESRFGRTCVVIERQQAMSRPGKVGKGGAQSPVSTFQVGYGFGLLLGIVAGLALPCEIVAPQSWHARLLGGLPKGKDSSIVRCLQLFPGLADKLKRKKDHGRAEALLIAEYGRREGVGRE